MLSLRKLLLITYLSLLIALVQGTPIPRTPGGTNDGKGE